MARLYRPHIPLEVRCRVALRQLGELWPDQLLAEWDGPLGALLDLLLAKLGPLINDAEIVEFHLDHDPALAAREKVFRKGVHVGYRPDANDPEFLIYREKTAHKMKTNLRGEHGQHPDRVLIKKNRRIEKKVKKSRSPRPKSTLTSPLRRWPKRELKSANRWPTTKRGAPT